MRSPTASTGCDVCALDRRAHQGKSCRMRRAGHGGVRGCACGIALRHRWLGGVVERAFGRAVRKPCDRLGVPSRPGGGARVGLRRLFVLMRRLAGDQRGQAAVEAAFALPVALLLVLLLVQPGILLYDRVVMQSAASEACRLLSTLDEADSSGTAEAFVRRRLGAVPEQGCFHVHEGGCSWEIAFEGGQASERVTCRIATQARPLPLIGPSAGFLGLVNGDGNFVVEVEASMPTQPSWALSAAAGSSPSEWIGAWVGESGE